MKLKKCSSTKISVNLRITTLVVMVIIIRVLTTKKNGHSSTEKVTTMIIITVIIRIYIRNNIAKTWLEHETGHVNAHGNIQAQKHYTEKVASNDRQGKNSGIYLTYHGPLSQEWIDGIYWFRLRYVMLAKVMNTTI